LKPVKTLGVGSACFCDEERIKKKIMGIKKKKVFVE
jgi:hypothetical protein